MTDEEIKTMLAENEALKKDKEEAEKTITDLTAERDSLKSENETYVKDIADLKESEKKLKETNFALARHLDIGKKEDASEILNKMF